MYTIIELPTTAENNFIYDIFEQEHEIDYKNRLFQVKCYYLKSVSPRFSDFLDVYIDNITKKGRELLINDTNYVKLKQNLKDEMLDSFFLEEAQISIYKVEE